MGSRRRVEMMLRLEPATVGRHEVTHLEVTTSYSMGGINYATYKDEPRGFYVSATPVKWERNESTGIDTVCFGAFSGLKGLLEAVPRFNAKKLDAHAAATSAALESKTGTAWEVIEAVLAKHGLKLADEKAAA